MNGYLTAEELSALIGCMPNSYACMRKYLRRNNWPFEPNLRGFPCVLREYHDRRMSGELIVANKPTPDVEPDFSMFLL